MNPQVLRRFIKLLALLTVVMFSVWAVTRAFLQEAPGDFHTRQGDIRIGEGKYEEAIESFNEALREMPNHRGALMGRALVYIRTNRPLEAAAELTHLIGFLEKNPDAGDATGRAALAAAYANRGIVFDRAGRHRKALADYIRALKTDEGAISGPGLIDKIIYGTPKPATVRDRALYLKRQLALPEDERLLRVPEIDKKQRMYKP
ncbi:MAG TPA: tetratricopeptide repeat protein [Nitrospinota bacterium]|nr:tetratricopeptide repeat protein [Nitrospinota bacterium]